METNIENKIMTRKGRSKEITPDPLLYENRKECYNLFDEIFEIAGAVVSYRAPAISMNNAVDTIQKKLMSIKEKLREL